MTHVIDDPAEFAPFSAILPVPVDVPTGWLCPYCKRVYGPQVRQCVICSPPLQPFTGPLPRPKAETCCLCSSADVAYHSFEDGRPLCASCAKNRRTIEPRPAPAGTSCQPPRADRLTLRLPPYLTGEFAATFMKVSTEWGDVFPGQPLQCRLRGEMDGMTVIEFRLTPRDDEHHD
jgi:hypothetical protein